MSDYDKMLEFAEKIGQFTQGLKTLKENFDKHLDDHKIDRIMQWVIIGLQTLVLLFLGYLKMSGKII